MTTDIKLPPLPDRLAAFTPRAADHAELQAVVSLFARTAVLADRAERAAPEIAQLHALLQHETPDAIRFRMLCEDHADPAVRERVRDIIRRLPVMSLSAARQAIDDVQTWIPTSGAGVLKS